MSTTASATTASATTESHTASATTASATTASVTSASATTASVTTSNAITEYWNGILEFIKPNNWEIGEKITKISYLPNGPITPSEMMNQFRKIWSIMNMASHGYCYSFLKEIIDDREYFNVPCLKVIFNYMAMGWKCIPDGVYYFPSNELELPGDKIITRAVYVYNSDEVNSCKKSHIPRHLLSKRKQQKYIDDWANDKHFWHELCWQKWDNYMSHFQSTCDSITANTITNITLPYGIVVSLCTPEIKSKIHNYFRNYCKITFAYDASLTIRWDNTSYGCCITFEGIQSALAWPAGEIWAFVRNCKTPHTAFYWQA